MARLKDRQRQIPGGFKFALPDLNYTSAPFASFDTIVNSVWSAIQANPAVAQARGWPQTRDDTAHWVDEFNADFCYFNGWRDYINGEPSGGPPKSTPPPSQAARLAAGAKTIAEWLGEGARPVSSDKAEERAFVCTRCPLNVPGDLSTFFTRAASDILRRQIASAREVDLVTIHDHRLGVCSACSCPMRLKVWVPINNIRQHMTDESRAALDKNCWIPRE